MIFPILMGKLLKISPKWEEILKSAHYSPKSGKRMEHKSSQPFLGGCWHEKVVSFFGFGRSKSLFSTQKWALFVESANFWVFWLSFDIITGPYCTVPSLAMLHWLLINIRCSSCNNQNTKMEEWRADIWNFNRILLYLGVSHPIPSWLQSSSWKGALLPPWRCLRSGKILLNPKAVRLPGRKAMAHHWCPLNIHLSCGDISLRSVYHPIPRKAVEWLYGNMMRHRK